jgi:Zn-dependent protease with chaperone function
MAFISSGSASLSIFFSELLFALSNSFSPDKSLAIVLKVTLACKYLVKLLVYSYNLLTIIEVQQLITKHFSRFSVMVAAIVEQQGSWPSPNTLQRVPNTLQRVPNTLQFKQLLMFV